MLKQSRISFLFFLLFTVLLSSCTKETPIPISNVKEFIEFKLEASLPTHNFSKDIQAQITGNEIKISVPKQIDITSLVPTFKFEGERVLIGDVEQKSAMTINDFSQPITYVVEALDGSKKQYKVVLEELQDSGLNFHSFSFKTKDNSGLSENSKTYVRGDTLYVRIKQDTKSLVASYTSSAEKVSIKTTTQTSGQTRNDFSSPVVYTLTSEYGYRKELTVIAERSTGLPHIYIDIEGGAIVTSKEDYLKANIRIEGEGLYDDFVGTTSIRGRGNSTWGYLKKPYRLKLEDKTSLFGLGAEKDWVLLANHIDESLMLNAVAMKTGKLLNMTYVNTIIPVDITMNGTYIGNYMFTEQVEVKPNRVQLDEGGVLLELDEYFDEDVQFRSSQYNLPVMFKSPKKPKPVAFDKVRNDFEALEVAMKSTSFPNSNHLEYIDKDALVDFLIVFNLTLNQEINHPKSVFMYRKNANAKFTMGPIWDFDWAFGYENGGNYFHSATVPLFWNRSSGGRDFFSRLMEDPELRTLYKLKWQNFKQNKLSELLVYVDNYAKSIEESARLNNLLWKERPVNFSATVAKLRGWLVNRANYIDTYVAGF